MDVDKVDVECGKFLAEVVRDFFGPLGDGNAGDAEETVGGDDADVGVLGGCAAGAEDVNSVAKAFEVGFLSLDRGTNTSGYVKEDIRKHGYFHLVIIA